MPRTSLTIEQILTMLAASPSNIAESTASLTEQHLHAALDEWSANDVLAHLRSCADVWGKSIVTIIEQDTPTIRAINPRTWIKSTDYLEQKFHPSLQAFTMQREELMKILEAVNPATWSRLAIVRGAGKPLQLSVYSYAQRMAEHERPHLKQIKHIAGAVDKSQGKIEQ